MMAESIGMKNIHRKKKVYAIRIYLCAPGATGERANDERKTKELHAPTESATNRHDERPFVAQAPVHLTASPPL